MKNLLIFLFLVASLKLLGQNTPAENTTLINTDIRGKVYLPVRMANTLQDLDNSVQHVAGVLLATGTDTYVVSANADITAYRTTPPFQSFDIQIPNTNTGSSTININGLGAKTIKKNVTLNLSAGDLIANGIYRVAYDGTNFQLLSGSLPLWGGIQGTITDQTDLVTYIASQLDGLNWLQSVVVRTTANITLSGEQTIDGVLTSADRVLVANQTLPEENGVYVSAIGAWSRATDADADAELEDAAVTVESGTSYINTTWVQTTDPVTLGSSDILWSLLGSGIADGDRGDITISLGGTAYTIDNGVVTFAKFQNLAAWSVFGRDANSVGVGGDITGTATGQVVRIAGSTVDFGAVDFGDTDAVTGNLAVTHFNGGTNANAGTVWAGDMTFRPGYPGNRFILKVQTGNYTPVIADSARTIILMRSAAAQTFTVPTFASVAYKKGMSITIIPDSTNTITFAAASGVSIESSAGDLLSHRQDAPIMLICKGVNRFYLFNGVPGGTGSSTSAGTRMRIIAKTASYAPVLADSNKTFAFRTASAVNFTLPTNAAVPWEIGTAISVVQDSTGVITFVAPSGGYVESSAGDLLSHGENVPLLVVKKSTNGYWLWNGTGGVHAGASVMGRSTNVAGPAIDILATGDGHILRRSGTGVQFGTIELGSGNAVGSSILRSQNGGTDVSVIPLGSLLVGSVANVWTTLPIGASGRVLTSNGTNASWQVPAGGGSGTVTSVTGTTNRILITGTPTVAPIINISPNYIGQNTITTVGNLTTGSWGATIIPINKGGTGTATPALVPGTNITITGAWPNQTISATGGGGGGITNGATLSEITIGDSGGNIVGSGLFSSTLGNQDFGGTSTTGATRTLRALGFAADVGFDIVPKGAGGFTITGGAGNFSFSGSDFTATTTDDITLDATDDLSLFGDVKVERVITAAGTTGARTINATSGTVNFAAGATSLVVTNSLVTTTSLVFPVVRTNDATSEIKSIVCASGSFTINLRSAATAETSVGFFVIN